MQHDTRRLMTLMGHGHRARVQPAKGPASWLRRLGWVAVVLVAVSVAGIAWRGEHGPEAIEPPASAGGPRADVRWWGNAELGTAPEPVMAVPAPVTVPPPATAMVSDGLFRLDERGQLQLDERTRLGVERLLALHDPVQLEQQLDRHLAGLPPPAGAAARQLVQQYAGYADAQKRSYPPGHAPLVAEEGLAELDGLQALRVSYFGSEAARRMFAEEDAIARRLLELMRDDPVPHASMEDKAMRAQVRLDEEMASGRFRPAGP
ncbi:MAG: lipase chaperone family protein [Hydrogenophaga sp.]|jgi:hypothetical protein|nr:lipase chaperone family protein [Hydrogenophaga sp.]